MALAEHGNQEKFNLFSLADNDLLDIVDYF
jgi:hypothetical protein